MVVPLKTLKTMVFGIPGYIYIIRDRLSLRETFKRERSPPESSVT